MLLIYIIIVFRFSLVFFLSFSTYHIELRNDIIIMNKSNELFRVLFSLCVDLSYTYVHVNICIFFLKIHLNARFEGYLIRYIILMFQEL